MQQQIMPAGAVPAPIEAQPDPILALIERLARDPNSDVEKVERLFGLREREFRARAEAAYNAAMAAAQAEMEPVARKHRNTQTNSFYADMAALAESITPIITKHGFGTSFSEFEAKKAGHIGVRIEVMHAGGFTKTYDYEVPTDAAGLKGNANKTATHAYGSTITYGRRYAKLCAFDVATKNDMDGNRAPPDRGPSGVITADQLAELQSLIKETGTDLARFLEYGNIQSLESIPAGQFASARDMLLTKKRKMQPAPKQPDEGNAYADAKGGAR